MTIEDEKSVMNIVLVSQIPSVERNAQLTKYRL